MTDQRNVKIDEHEDFDRVTTAISRVMAPVLICMILAVWLVNSLGNGCPDSNPKSSATPSELPAFKPIQEEKQPPAKPKRGTPLQFGKRNAIIFTAIFVVLIVVFTYFLVFLFKKGYNKVIFGWLFLAVFLIFGYVGGMYLFEFCRSRCIDLDWITLTFVTWNFSVGGIVAVFGSAPRFINQSYLIVMSALMAYVFRQLPEAAIWVILGVLVVWDLFAVLTPWGPLRALVEHAKEKGENLPALVYDTNPKDIGRDPDAQPAILLVRKKNRKKSPTSRNQPAEAGEPDAEGGAEADAGEGDKSGKRKFMKRRRRKKDDEIEPTAEENENNVVPTTSTAQDSREVAPTDNAASGGDGIAPVPASITPRTEGGTAPTDASGGGAQAGQSRPKKLSAEGTLGTHLKLGLGDFVFYSILVAQASRHGGAMTTVTSFVAILAGLCMTLFLVLVYRKALPALPISIVFGMIFYFLTKYTVQPFVESMFVFNAYH